MKIIEKPSRRNDAKIIQKPLQKSLTVIEDFLSSYPTIEQFLNSDIYNPDGQTTLCRNVNDCWFGEHPTLCLLDEVYRKSIGEAWLVPQLANISEYAGTKDKLTKSQIKDCAFVIRNNYGYLKVSEFMLFFHRFKAGFFGDFYGAVSPLSITKALRQFMSDRAVAIEHHEQKEREALLKEQKKNAVSYEEYCRMRGIPASTSQNP